MSAQAAGILREAAGTIAKLGLNKGQFTCDTGEVCMWGAINLAFSGDVNFALDTDLHPDDLRAQTAVRAEIAATLYGKFPEDGGGWPGAWSLNDMPSTTSEDVQKFLLQTADELEFSDAA